MDNKFWNKLDIPSWAWIKKSPMPVVNQAEALSADLIFTYQKNRP
jgi:hypothetical protein